MEQKAIRVMVVDDHPMWRDAVERDLAGAGFDVVATAANGTEALNRAPAARPEVVVLDLQIPAPARLFWACSGPDFGAAHDARIFRVPIGKR